MQRCFSYQPFGLGVDTEFLQFGDEILGYLSDLKIKLTVNGVVNYQSKFAIFVSYQNTNLVCVPSVTLSGCAAIRAYQRIFTQSNHIKIWGNVIYYTDGSYVSKSKPKSACEQNAKYHWKIRNDSNRVVVEYYELKEISFDPYTLNFTDYKVLLEVTSSMQTEPSQSFA